MQFVFLNQMNPIFFNQIIFWIIEMDDFIIFISFSSPSINFFILWVYQISFSVFRGNSNCLIFTFLTYRWSNCRINETRGKIDSLITFLHQSPWLPLNYFRKVMKFLLFFKRTVIIFWWLFIFLTFSYLCFGTQRKK